MRRNFTFFSLLLGCVLLLSSCSYRITDFTIISTKNVELSKAGTFTRGTVRNEGEDRIHMILYFPTGRPDLKEAIDRAIEKTPGAVALVDGVAYSKFWWAFFYGESKIVVEGTPLIDPSLLSTDSGKIPDYAVAKFDKEGDVIGFEEITKDEYVALKGDVVKGSKEISIDKL